MPLFGTPSSVTRYPRKFTPDEAARAIRLSVAAEYEAVQLYEQIAEALPPDMGHLEKLYLDITREELVHAGEFLEALRTVSPGEFEAYREGALEAREIMGMVQDMSQVYQHLETPAGK